MLLYHTTRNVPEKAQDIQYLMDKEEYISRILFKSGVLEMWCALVCVKGGKSLQPDAGSTAGQNTVRMFLKNEAEYFNVKHLLMNHLWNKFGDE